MDQAEYYAQRGDTGEIDIEQVIDEHDDLLTHTMSEEEYEAECAAKVYLDSLDVEQELRLNGGLE
jgi:hypothetical protein